MPAEWELVLDLDHGEDPNEIRCYYYFVNHSNRTLFWLHEFDVSPLLNGLYDVKSMRRIRESTSHTPVFDSVIDRCPQNKHWRAIIGKLILEDLSRGG